MIGKKINVRVFTVNNFLQLTVMAITSGRPFYILFFTLMAAEVAIGYSLLLN